MDIFSKNCPLIAFNCTPQKKKRKTKAPRRDIELQSSELRGNKNDLNAQIQIQLTGFETKSVALFFLKSLFKKKNFGLTVYLEEDETGPTKGCARVLLQNAACMTKVNQKRGHDALNLCVVGEGISEHGFFEPG